MADAKRLSQFIQGNHSRVSLASLKAAEILLAQPRSRLDSLLRQALFPSQASKISTDQLAHVHAQGLARHTL
jgi:hypothetical protein